MNQVTCQGGCHCGAVRFEIQLPQRVEARRCNCSICAMTGYVHVTVPRKNFRLVGGADRLREYRFNTGTARHLFCEHCGIKSFYVPRSHPDCYSVNLNCIDLPPSLEVNRAEFDGQNWEENVHNIRHLGK